MAIPIINATGRRKTAVASVFLKSTNKKNEITVNGLTMDQYFDLESWRNWVLKPLNITNHMEGVSIKCKLIGGGKSAQAQALSLGISRALEKMDNNLRAILKSNKLLTRDSREKERQKPGQKGARAKYQYGKR